MRWSAIIEQPHTVLSEEEYIEELIKYADKANTNYDDYIKCISKLGNKPSIVDIINILYEYKSNKPKYNDLFSSLMHYYGYSNQSSQTYDLLENKANNPNTIKSLLQQTLKECDY